MYLKKAFWLALLRMSLSITLAEDCGAAGSFSYLQCSQPAKRCYHSAWLHSIQLRYVLANPEIRSCLVESAYCARRVTTSSHWAYSTHRYSTHTLVTYNVIVNLVLPHIICDLFWPPSHLLLFATYVYILKKLTVLCIHTIQETLAGTCGEISNQMSNLLVITARLLWTLSK